jgi:hypothetical protein
MVECWNYGMMGASCRWASPTSTSFPRSLPSRRRGAGIQASFTTEAPRPRRWGLVGCASHTDSLIVSRGDAKTQREFNRG